MKKNMKKIISSIATVLMLATAALPVMAAPTDEKEPSAAVHLTKTFISPDSSVVTLPTDEFTFEFEVSQGAFFPYGSTTEDTSVTAPTISNQTLTFKDSVDTGLLADGAKTTYKQTDDLLSGLTFPEAGVYEYTVTEKQGSIAGLAGHEHIQYDGTTYTLRVYVSRDDQGDLVIDGGTVENGTDKVDPDPQTPGGNGEDEVTAANGFNFKNIYTVDAGGVTPPDPDPEFENAGFLIDKQIKGDLSNANDEFEFTLTLTNNAAIDGKKYTVKIKDANGTVTELTDLVVPGTPTIITLKGGERAYLLDVPAGVTYTVTESQHGYYTPSIVNAVNSQKQITDIVETDYALGKDGGGVLGLDSNFAAYLNTWNTVAPTGIFVDNLPYIALVLVALAGISLFIIDKRRRRA